MLPATVEPLRNALDPDSDTDQPQGACRSVLVRYETGPDRRTFYPAGGSTERVLGEWIAADDDAVLRLDGWR